MARIKFGIGEQRKFFEKIFKHNDLTIKKLAKNYSLNPRTIRDWRREKYNANYEIILDLSKKFGVSLKRIKKLDNYWYIEKNASIGGKTRYKLYGPPGTPDGRIKGGLISQKKRRKNPEKYKVLGCNIKKRFTFPVYSKKLAELIGILMGDGSITNNQVRITLNKNTDKKYADFVSNLMSEVFKEFPSRFERDNTINLTISGIELVKIIEKIGFKKGNKVFNQINFPQWIMKNKNYQISCVRGLFDTDGCLYFHKKDKKTYLGWCFSNHSKPLINKMFEILINLGLNIKKSGETKIYLYGVDNISKYFKIIASNNPRNINKFIIYNKYLRRDG